MKGNDIKKIRETFGFSMPEFADLIGVQTSSIYRWEALKAKAAKIEGLPRKLLQLMLELKQKERDGVAKALRRGGWMLALSNLLMVSLKKSV
jgi:DNA-binding transcriptional regulator YiaG